MLVGMVHEPTQSFAHGRTLLDPLLQEVLFDVGTQCGLGLEFPPHTRALHKHSQHRHGFVEGKKQVLGQGVGLLHPRPPRL